MITPVVPIFRKRKKRPRAPQFGPPPVALTLLEAGYADLRGALSFDRDINIEAFDPTQIIIDDADSGNRLRGVGPATLGEPNRVDLSFEIVGSIPVGVGTWMDATAATGIVAVDDGGTWNGAEHLQLPFP